MSIDAGQADEAAWLAEVLTGQIPLGGAMQLSIARLDDECMAVDAVAATLSARYAALGRVDDTAEPDE